MSHYSVLVVLPQGTTDVAQTVKEMLAPFDEGLRVEPYMKGCGCLGHNARKAALAAAEAYKPFTQLRDEFRTAHHAKDDDWWFGKESDVLWQAHMAEYVRIEETTAQEHPDFNSPDPDCEECSGTGLYETTYNPRSRWDWWKVGGRWHGYYDATGRERDVLCICDVKEPPFAYIRPDGSWREKAKVGWWGTSSHEQPEEAWTAEWAESVTKYAGHQVVCCDLHI